jgi:hypothetical protein
MANNFIKNMFGPTSHSKENKKLKKVRPNGNKSNTDKICYQIRDKL